MNTNTTNTVFLNEVLHGGICPLCFGLKTTKSRYGRSNPGWRMLQVLEDKHHCQSCGNTWTTSHSEKLTEWDYRTPKVDKDYPHKFVWTTQMEEVTNKLAEYGLKLSGYNDFYTYNREGLLASVKEIFELPEDERKQYLSGYNPYEASWNKVKLSFSPRDSFTLVSAQSYDTSPWSGGRYGY